MEKWMEIAVREVGIAELPGNKDNDRIVTYLSTVFSSPQHDEVAWCSAFMNFVMLQAGFKGTFSAAARSWVNWGKPIDIPREGAVIVSKRGTQEWQGHVSLFISKVPGGFRVLGGNQGDKVGYMTIPEKDVIAIRWPEGVK